MKHFQAHVIVAGVLLHAAASTWAAEPRVSMEIGTLPGFPISGAQEWNKLLGEIGITNLTIRSAQPGEKPAIETDRAGDVVVYRITGLLTTKNELQLPAGRFKPSDRGRLVDWLKRLREQGPEVSTAAKRPPFGLEARQLEAVRDDLAARLDVPTAGQRPEDLIEKLAPDLGYPLEVTGEALAALAEAEPVAEELSDVARGSAIAAIVRPAGLGFWPVRTTAGQVEYRIAVAKGEQDTWPVGWPLLEKREQVAPQLFEFLTVAIDDITLAEALAAIGPRLKMPVLIDHNALARARIDLANERVSYPEKRTTYSIALQAFLAQASLKWEVRLDEANRPLIWITTVRR